MNNKRKHNLTQDQCNQIKTMLTGPFLPEWKNEFGIVQNSDKVIAERLNLPKHVVTEWTARLMNLKHKNICKL